ncbi:MAG: hypothetical protein WBN38_10620, partial [Polyangiales bacterium]
VDLRPIPDALPAEPAEPVPELVRLRVTTDPTGGAVIYGDDSTACEAAPCTLEAAPGAHLVLRAKLGKRRGRVAITPTQDETVLIQLKAPRKAATKKGVSEQPAPRRAARSSDLKVPEWAQ